MKKLFAIIMSVILIISLFSIQIRPKFASASSKVWDGTVDISWYKDGVTSFNLSKPEQLAGLSQLCDGGNTFSGVTINLTSDINLNHTSNYKKWLSKAPKNTWNPIGGISSWVRERHFDGVFNGNGHTISGMYVKCDKPGGFFSVTQNAAIVNLRFNQCLIVPTGYASGTIVGESYYSYIANCEAKNVMIYETDPNNCHDTSVGTLVGASPINYGGAGVFMAFMSMGLIVNPLIIAAVEENKAYDGTVITDCKVDGFTLRCGADRGNARVGGVIGGADNGAFLYNCLVMNGSVSANDTTKSGESVCGVLHAGGKGDVSNCYFYKVSTKNAAKTYGAGDNVKKVSKKTLLSEEFVEKLGNSFKRVSGKAPGLKWI